MSMPEAPDSALLAPYRALDLTDEKGFLCGKVLGDLGADVIKVEPPGGEPGRNIGPFHHDVPHPERSLYWFAFNANKRGITLNLETTDGREIFKKLVKEADFVIESSSPGRMEELGLGYSVLSEINPGIVMTSITPFGQSGPYRDYKAPDLVDMAMGGYMYLCGDPDRPPVRISFPQAYLHAAADAAAGTMIALYHRQKTGIGQHVDISMQHSLVMTTLNAIPFWEVQHSILERVGAYRSGLSSGATQRQTWRCRDGFVTFTMYGGQSGARTNQRLTSWMGEMGMGDDFLSEMDWEEFDAARATQDIWDRIEEPIARFFSAYTKAELFRGAVKRGIMLYPVSTPRDLLASPQLEARDFWTEVAHPELGCSITYPGAFVKASQTPWQIRRRAPLIGEHNQEIYEGELGLSLEELATMKQAGII